MHLEDAWQSKAVLLLIYCQLLVTLATSYVVEAVDCADLDNCAPTCTLGCPENSQCAGPDYCECDEGFTPLQRNCQPICSLPCPPHAACVAPNSCECSLGYALVGHACAPKCSKGCAANEECVAPEVCRCRPGYERGSQVGACVPACPQGCSEHATCARPNHCVCEEGFHKMDGLCIAEAECMQELLLWFIHMQVSCQFHVLAQCILFGCGVALLLLLCVPLYMAYRAASRRGSTPSHSLEYVITYQPHSPTLAADEALVETLGRRLLPPPYSRTFLPNKSDAF